MNTEKETENKIKLVVLDENVLGYIHPSRPEYIYPLRISILRGAWGDSWEPRLKNSGTFRLATEKDFNDFNVSFEGYKKHPEEYEWDNNFNN